MPHSIEWKDGALYLLDQTRLPLTTVVERQDSLEQVWDSIKQLKVRGAPAIGIAGAYGLVVGLREKIHLPVADFLAEVDRQADYLDSARPTAVNLHWALTRLVDQAKAISGSPADILLALEQTAIQIHEEDRRLCQAIGTHGKALIRAGMGVLTHCNAGALATSELGTALAPLYLAHQQGTVFRVYADETRPLLQGARLTSWELQQQGLDVTLICDSMAAQLMSQGVVDFIIVGADRVAANGDVANKIGTLSLAIAAQYFEIPFYVACPYSTIDFETPNGKAIVIEERHESEVTHFGERRTAPQGIKVRNPAFDVTPNLLITGLITERGVLHPPYATSLKQHYAQALL
ncbi:MAG: S-methyl-5-thioribose-1-phosphate isomerase [Leptolyngbya sp. SIO1D8]|nr:S-methyl-5-thioribose-1-phosphate isomerase [Leptolyngbya sp. SIO1D8]